MKKYVNLLIFIFIITSLTLTITIIATTPSYCSAEESTAPLYHREISNGTYSDVYIADLPYSTMSTFYYTYGSSSDSSSGLGYYLNLYNCDKYLVLNVNNESVTTTVYSGKYCSKYSSGSPSKVIIYSTYYTIAYELNGGTNNDNNPTYYDDTSSRLSLYNPTKDDYVFIGWYTDSGYTNSISYISASLASDLTLYARWSEILETPIYNEYTDYYSIHNDLIGNISYYYMPTLKYYCYLSVEEKMQELNCTDYYILDSESNQLNFYIIQGHLVTKASDGEPSCIHILTPYYSISYMLYDGNFDSLYASPNYYYTKSDLSKIDSPIKNNYIFVDWYLDADYSSTFSSSDFTPQNITLYAKWENITYISIYYYDSSQESPELKQLQNTYYYTRANIYYCYGSSSNTGSQLGYYLNKYETNMFEIFDKDNNKLTCLANNGYYLSTIESGTPDHIYIYTNYTAEFYVNGQYYYECYGNVGDLVVLPDFICGYIGKNYDALETDLFTIGNKYSLYIMKGWSLTDTSDKTWFNETEVDLISNDYAFSFSDNFVIKLYAYMTFYGKLSSDSNESIDYESYISETKGIITTSSMYSLDDLMNAHVTEISSDENEPSFIDKIAKWLHIDLSNSSIELLNKIFNGDSISFSEIWNTIVGKVLTILVSIVILILITILSKISIKLFSNTDSNT